MKTGKKIEFILICIISFGIVFGVLCGVGTMFSGWHFVDDHEYAEYAYLMKFQHMSPLQVMHQWVEADMGIRFRPLYHPIRILLVCIFGLNLTAISAVRGMVIALTLIFLYYCGRLMGANPFYSIMFALTSMVGYQGAAWWKLGPQESFGTMLMAAGFYLMLKWLAGGKKSYAVISLILFGIMANYKESYVVVLPFIFAYVIYDRNRDSRTLRDIWKSGDRLKGCKWYLYAISIMFLALVAIIVFAIGTDGYSGAGIDLSTKLGTYVTAAEHELTTDLRWYRYCTLFLIAVLLTYWEDLKKMWKEMVLALSFLLPQTVLYAQTGFLERYILPASVGYSLFFVVLVSIWKPLQGKRRKFYAAVLVIMLLLNTRAMLVEADYFRYRGESITTMMTSVREMAGTDKKVLSCLSPHEESNITLKYWMLMNDYDQVYYWHQKEQTIDQEFQYDKYPELTGSNTTEISLDDIDIVVMYNRNDRDFDHEVNLNLSDFTEVDCGTLTIYVRNNDGITIPKIDVRPSYYYAQD